MRHSDPAQDPLRGFGTPSNFERLAPELETAIFRIVQECLTNIHRHSGSRVATVYVTGNGNEVKVEAKTKVKECLQAETARMENVSVGIQEMCERIVQFGGRFEIRSDKKGTRLVAMVPVKSSLLQTATRTGFLSDRLSFVAIQTQIFPKG